MTITSTDNRLIKQIASLKDAKGRNESGQFLVEGERIVKDFLSFSASPYQIEHLIVAESKSTMFENYAERIIVSDRVFDKISDTVSSQGVLAVAKIPQAKQVISGNYLVLDNISDPGNLGTIMRTAAAVGFSDLILLGGADPFNPKVIRSSMGGVFFLNIIKAKAVDLPNLISGTTLYAADMAGENVFETSFSDKKNGLLVGNEANGVSNEALKLADKIISLPMQNVESLNAAVAASIIIYLMKKF